MKRTSFIWNSKIEKKKNQWHPLEFEETLEEDLQKRIMEASN